MQNQTQTKKYKNNAPILSLDKPLTLNELAQIIGPRLGEPRRNKSAAEIIEYWMTQGYYGIKLETWVAQSARITTLKKYQDFRREVAEARKRQAVKLYDYLCTKREQVTPPEDEEFEDVQETAVTLQFSRN